MPRLVPAWMARKTATNRERKVMNPFSQQLPPWVPGSEERLKCPANTRKRTQKVNPTDATHATSPHKSCTSRQEMKVSMMIATAHPFWSSSDRWWCSPVVSCFAEGRQVVTISCESKKKEQAPGGVLGSYKGRSSLIRVCERCESRSEIGIKLKRRSRRRIWLKHGLIKSDYLAFL